MSEKVVDVKEIIKMNCRRVSVITFSTNTAPKHKRVVWNICKLNTNEEVFDPSDKEAILLKEDGVYEFNLKILGVIGKNCYPCISFNGTPEMWLYSSGQGYQDCQLSGYHAFCRKNTMVRVELINGGEQDQNIYVNTSDTAGKYHFLSIKKLD